MAMISTASGFINNCIQSQLSIVKILLQSKFFTPGLKVADLQKVIVLGNGPSLTKEINQDPAFFERTPKMAVNLFVKSEYYTRFKPEFYVINAPEHWFEKVNEMGANATSELYTLMNEKTTWPITLLIPFKARKYQQWKDIIKENKNITVHYYNKTPVEGFSWLRNWAYKKSLGMPRPHNVVIPALVLAVNTGYKKIFLAGVDHSWLGGIRVEHDNTVTMEHTHAFGNTVRYPIFAYIDEKRHLHDILMKFVNTFKSYFLIRDFAEKQNCSIVNITEDSFIDAFEKRKPGQWE